MPESRFTTKKNSSGPGYHVLDPEGTECVWVFEQGPLGDDKKDKKRAEKLQSCLTP